MAALARPAASASASGVVTAIGSCRVENPVKIAARAHGFRCENGHLYNLVHNTSEILQQIAHMRGNRRLPRALWSLFARRESMVDLPAEPRPADLYLVEISSQKVVAYQEVFLQINNLYQMFRDRLDLLGLLYRFGLPAQRPARAEALARHPAFAGASAFERAVLSDATVAVQDRAALEADLAAIAHALGAPCVFVAHCDVTGRDGRRIAERSRLVQWLTESCARLGLACFDPNPLIAAHGQAAAMAEEGRDVNHYQPLFETTLSEVLHALHIAPFLGARAAVASGNP